MSSASPSLLPFLFEPPFADFFADPATIPTVLNELTTTGDDTFVPRVDR